LRAHPYTDKPDYYGILAIDLEELTGVICEAHKAGFQIAGHANGDRAVDFALKSFEKAFKNFPRRNHRHRIEHCSVVNRQLIERIKKLKIIPILFAAYPYYHGDKLISAFGSERVHWLMAYQSFLDEGVKVASHSDFPCSPFSPLLGMHSIVNRVTMEGKLFGPEQGVSPKEALRTYTTYAAYSTFEARARER
jgi:predicted amidohydrolase YtcJ